MLTNFQSAIDLASNGRKRMQSVGQTREAYLANARRYCLVAMDKLIASGEYRHVHESFLIRDTLLVIEQWFPDLGTSGVEHIEAGSNHRSPAIDYLNTGDTYDLTIMFIRGRFRVGCWGDIVERGNYA